MATGTSSERIASTSGHDCADERRRQMNSALITASQTGLGAADGQPRLERLKRLIWFSGGEPGLPRSSSLLFQVARREAVCSCPRLFTAGGLHTARRRTKATVFEQQVLIQSWCLHAAHPAQLVFRNVASGKLYY